MHDCCVIGGGVIGLSIARELAGRGLRVHVVARDAERQTASWAAAGIFPPAPRFSGAGAGDLLTAWSDELHRVWSAELRDETGIDNGLVACGGLYVAADDAHHARLEADIEAWRSKGTRCEPLDAPGLAALEPGLRIAVDRGRLRGGYLLADEMQIRPPRHLEALVRSCGRRGVTMSHGPAVEAIGRGDGMIDGVALVQADGRRTTVRAGAYVLAAGAWSGDLARQLGFRLDTRPIRGQIALYRFPSSPVRRVVNLGLEYLVPRPDGRLLVGSTLEDAGFDAVPTTAGLARLADVAELLLGDLAAAVRERTWAGLRPGSVDGLPTIGRLPTHGNAFIATGHFRAGLHQSTGTAVVVADLVTGRQPPLDLRPFAPHREPVTRP
jgi:glycine oxidase